ncbi:MAG: hypothetical protein BWY70_01184 [Bacteroidetes bacterium ADurb.Bin408]|nr:MAG: hypothetical protein BWY70_01184 [Bacteroidetes bacterium ADurb.Bin408]
MKIKVLLLALTILFYLLPDRPAQSQTILLGPENFDTDILVHGVTAPVNVWFAPNYNSPIDFYAAGGCTGGYSGYSGSWNNYWGNFLRTPEVNCTGTDSVILSFDISNSFVSGHPNDKVYFNMWVDGAYHDASSNQTISFNQARDCEHFEVIFDLTPYTNKNVLFYLNASCGYNDAQLYSIKFDNIVIYSFTTTQLNEKQHRIESINVFPNPSSGMAIFRFDNHGNEPLSLSIYDALGQLIQKAEHVSNSEVTIDNRAWHTGFYYYQLQSEKKTVAAGKLIKQ